MTRLLEAAFAGASTKYPDLMKDWITVSYRLGCKLPASMLVGAVQRDGRVDVLVRCLEDEYAATLAKGGEAFTEHLNMLSEYWIGGMYETLRLLRERKLVDSTPEFVALFRDFELVRMQLEKHELANDKKQLKGKPLTFTKLRPTGTNDEYVDDVTDDKRAHIPLRGPSTRGSTTWQVIDLKQNNQSRWVERRELADKVLAMCASELK